MSFPHLVYTQQLQCYNGVSRCQEGRSLQIKVGIEHEHMRPARNQRRRARNWLLRKDVTSCGLEGKRERLR